MQMAQRAIRRLAFIGWLGLFGLTGLPAHLAQAAAPPERVLPDTTLFLLKLNDVKSFRESFRSSQYGQLWNDPGLKDFRDDLARIDVPTLVIQGDADRILPIAATGRRTAKLIKGARQVVVKDGPHCITWTHAEEVNAELLSFLAEKTGNLRKKVA